MFVRSRPQGELGSPPQVRGKPVTPIDAITQERITPAGAGKTKKLQFSADGMEDHPRRCGENIKDLSPYIG